MGRVGLTFSPDESSDPWGNLRRPFRASEMQITETSGDARGWYRAHRWR